MPRRSKYPGIYQRGDRWTGQAYLPGGRRKPIGTHDTERQAWQAKLAILAEGGRSSKGKETVTEFAARWRDDYNFVRADGSMRWGDEHVQNMGYALKPLVVRFGPCKLSAFPMEEAAPWAAKQPRYIVRTARLMFNDARKSHLIASNPFSGLGIEQSRGRSDIIAITEEELHLLADQALTLGGAHGRMMRAMVLFSGYVGSRLIGTRHIRPEDVDLAAGTVYLRKPGKRVPPRHVVIFAEAAAALERLPRTLRGEWLFTTTTGRKFSNSTLYDSWNPIRTAFAAKLDPRRAEELRQARPTKGGMKGEMTWHELRHCAATIMARNGVAREDAAWQLCQESGGELVDRVYTHLTDAERLLRVRAAFRGTENSHADPHASEAI